MIRSALLFLLAAPLVAPFPAIAQDAADGTPSAAPENGSITVEREREKKPRKVCTRTVSTGSIMSKIVCKPAAQVEAEQAEAERAIERLQDDQETSQQTALQRGNAQK